MQTFPLFAAGLLAIAPINASASATQTKWSLYALGGYSIAFPGDPEPQANPSLPVGFRSWSLAVGSNPYVFSLTDVKEDDAKSPPDALLAQCVSGFLSASKGRITGERDLLFDGWPGVEILFKQEPNTEGRLRAYVVKNQIVNLIVTRPAGATEPDGVTKFFSSIKLPSDIQKGTLTQAGPQIVKYDLDSSGFAAKVPAGVRSGPIKIGDGPTAVQMHRFASAYLNRVYMGVVIDPPAIASKNLDNDTTGLPAQAVNKSIASLFGQVISKTDSKTTPLGKDWTADFELGHALVGHLETYIRNNHTYSLLAIIPLPMLQSEEVKTFFDSVTLPAKT